jgi:hypothetical protein
MIVSGSSERQIAPQGIHIAYLCWKVDLGTQFNDNSDKSSRRVLLHFELSETRATFKKERGPEPFLVHAEYSANVRSKSFLRRDWKRCSDAS